MELPCGRLYCQLPRGVSTLLRYRWSRNLPSPSVSSIRVFLWTYVGLNVVGILSERAALCQSNIRIADDPPGDIGSSHDDDPQKFSTSVCGTVHEGLRWGITRRGSRSSGRLRPVLSRHPRLWDRRKQHSGHVLPRSHHTSPPPPASSHPSAIHLPHRNHHLRCARDRWC